MALTEETVEDKIEIVSKDNWKAIQVRDATIVKRDGVEINRSFHRHIVMPNISSDDLAKESADVQAFAAQIFTDEVKTAYAAHLESMIPE
tara:strand:+ start:703 stop:972 length:270 start_codon:yes stop_codon:yes gene_type:complete